MQWYTSLPAFFKPLLFQFADGIRRKEHALSHRKNLELPENHRWLMTHTSQIQVIGNNFLMILHDLDKTEAKEAVEVYFVTTAILNLRDFISKSPIPVCMVRWSKYHYRKLWHNIRPTNQHAACFCSMHLRFLSTEVLPDSQ
ncbi:MAG: hypothetical protein ACTS7E_03845 [Arsenophonus sp. NC-CH8-MAG3]